MSHLSKAVQALQRSLSTPYAILKFERDQSSWRIVVGGQTVESDFKTFKKAEERCQHLVLEKAVTDMLKALRTGDGSDIVGSHSVTWNKCLNSIVEGENFK